jgi:hypothetical protein
MIQWFRDLFSGALFLRICAWNPGAETPPKGGKFNDRWTSPKGVIHICTVDGTWVKPSKRALALIDHLEEAGSLVETLAKQRDEARARAVPPEPERPIPTPIADAFNEWIKEHDAHQKKVQEHIDDLTRRLALITSERDYLKGYLHYADWHDAAKAAIENALKARTTLANFQAESFALRTEEAGWRGVVQGIAMFYPMACDSLDDACRVREEVVALLSKLAALKKQATLDQAYLYTLTGAEDGGQLLGRFESTRIERVILTLNIITNR